VTQTTTVSAPKIIHTSNTVVFDSGWLRRDLRFPFRTNAGPVSVVLKSPKASVCAMSLVSRSSETVGRTIKRNIVRLRESVEKGRYTVLVHCRNAAKRPYELDIYLP
jgi:hypothetical protein